MSVPLLAAADAGCCVRPPPGFGSHRTQRRRQLRRRRLYSVNHESQLDIVLHEVQVQPTDTIINVFQQETHNNAIVGNPIHSESEIELDVLPVLPPEMIFSMTVVDITTPGTYEQRIHGQPELPGAGGGALQPRGSGTAFDPGCDLFLVMARGVRRRLPPIQEQRPILHLCSYPYHVWCNHRFRYGRTVEDTIHNVWSNTHFNVSEHDDDKFVALVLERLADLDSCVVTDPDFLADEDYLFDCEEYCLVRRGDWEYHMRRGGEPKAGRWRPVSQ